MPALKQITCQIQWANTNAPFHEYGTVYGDGVVETFIAVPSTPQPFSIHLASRGFIATGLAMIVFIDGTYQCNRNRINLMPARNGTPRTRTEVDFIVRQKEKPMGEGIYMGREWRFDNHNIVSDLPPDVKCNHFDRLGTIEVLVLRCSSPSTDDADLSTTSSGADSNVLSRNVAERDGTEIDTAETISKIENGNIADHTGAETAAAEFSDLPFAGLFDGQNDGYHSYQQYSRDQPYGPDGWDTKQPPAFFGSNYYRPRISPRLSGHVPTSEHIYRDASEMHRFEPPRSERHVHFDMGPQPDQYKGLRPSCFDQNSHHSPIFWQQQQQQPLPPPGHNLHAPERGSPRLAQAQRSFLQEHPSQEPHPAYHRQPDHFTDIRHESANSLFPPPPPITYEYRAPYASYASAPYAAWPTPYSQWPVAPPLSSNISIPIASPYHPTFNPQPPPIFAQGPGYLTSQAMVPTRIPTTSMQDFTTATSNVHEGCVPLQGSLDPARDENNTTDMQTGLNDWTKPNDSNDNALNNDNNGINWNDSTTNTGAVANDIWPGQNTTINDQVWGNSDNNNNWNSTNTGNGMTANTWGDSSGNNVQSVSSSGPASKLLYGPHGPLYAFRSAEIENVPADAEEEPYYDVPKSIADVKRTTKQVQPGRGYLYTKKRCVPKYIDSLEEPYARFVFKYRTKDQIKTEIGIDIEDEPTGDQEVQNLQKMEKSELIDMLLRVKSLLGGEIPESQKPLKATTTTESTIALTPVEPPSFEFLRYTLPPLRRSQPLTSNPDIQTTSNDINWNSPSNNGNNAWNAAQGNNGRENSGNDQKWNDNSNDNQWSSNNVTSAAQNWDGVQEKDKPIDIVQQEDHSHYKPPSVLEIPDSPATEPEGTWR